MTRPVPIALIWLAATAPAVTLANATRETARQVTVDAVVARAADYVARFTDTLSNVVGEEQYIQTVTGAASSVAGRSGRRQLRSDIVLLKIGGPLEWRPYRDVFEVDGKPVRDRDDRLMRLFQQPSATSFEQAARIAQESARFNIGLAGRTVNTPVLSLLFLQRSIQPRFRFKLGKHDAAVGPRVWVVEYREDARPTLIRGLLTGDSTDLPASGRFWIDADTGRVAKAELLFAVVGMRASLVTSFRRDDRLGIDVPAELRETYRLQRTITEVHREEGWPTANEVIEETVVDGTAIYRHFRQFEVSTDTTTAPVAR